MPEDKLHVSTGKPELGAPTLIINPPAKQEQPSTEPVNKEMDNVQEQPSDNED